MRSWFFKQYRIVKLNLIKIKRFILFHIVGIKNGVFIWIIIISPKHLRRNNQNQIIKYFLICKFYKMSIYYLKDHWLYRINSWKDNLKDN